MEKRIAALVASCLLLMISFAPAESAAAQQAQNEEISTTLEKAVEKKEKELDLGLSTIYTTWKRCDVFKSHPGENDNQLEVVKLWTCEDVSTKCQAILKDHKAFATSSCYYASRSENQHLTFQTSRLVPTEGEEISLEDAPQLDLQDFVVFQL